MSILTKVVAALENVLGSDADELAEKHAVIVRQRKFTGRTLLQMLVMSILKKPNVQYQDMATTAAQLGVVVSEAAVKKRFNQRLVDFVRDSLGRAVQRVVAAEPVVTPLLNRFTAVFIGDSSTIPLPSSMAEQFPGCGGSHGSGSAALKIQVRWDLKTGELPLVLIEAGRASDAKSLIAQQKPLAGSLEIYDLGYFSLKRFKRLDEAKAYFVSRLQSGTSIMSAEDKTEIDLLEYLTSHKTQKVLDIPVLMGKREQVPCRMIAVQVPEEMANRRRQKAHQKARDSGRQASAKHLAMLDWSIYVTNLPADQLTWKEAVVLYRSRWQIELLFKLWKSHNKLEQQCPRASAEETMALLWAKLLAVLVQHWLILLSTWQDERRSLNKAAAALQDWISVLTVALRNHKQLTEQLKMLQTQLAQCGRISTRKNQLSHFQLLRNPELLDWAA